MFGAIVSGRLVDATPQAITDTQYAFRIPSTPAFSHIVVFMLPGTQLPSGMAATVYVQIPPSTEFKLLGGIGTGKESAIFKVSGLKSAGSENVIEADGDVMIDADATAGQSLGTPQGEVVVGISIEPIAQVEAQLNSLKAGPAATTTTSTALARLTSTSDGRATTKVLAQRIIGNAFNFLASFGSDNIPLKAFHDWWTKFEKKIDLDPSFLERIE